MLPTPILTAPVEPLLSADENVCDPQDDRAGVRKFVDFVIANQGGVEGRIVGPCDGKSGHASGRAWDWMVSADDPAERAHADDLVDWLLANGAEMFRRTGLSYVIWDRQIWSAKHPEWRPYDGPSAHTDHVHFSFNALGAEGLTSFYSWLDAGEPVTPAPRPTPLAKVGVNPLLVGFAVGFAALLLASNTEQGQRFMRSARARIF
jgi:hypothetical protein